MIMNLININGYTLRNLDKINIVLGKNGCGKSIMLRQVEQGLPHPNGNICKSKYITPERGGALTYEAGIEQSLTTNVDWLSSQRRRNLSNNFRQQSVAQFRKLETLVLRELETSILNGNSTPEQLKDHTFNSYVEKINTLLDNIKIKRHDVAFKIYKKGTNDELQPNVISSGESELISLGIECLIFSKECDPSKDNILFLDEPDVHLHPDLQVRLMRFLKELVTEVNFLVLIATHSTSILGALDSYENAHIAFMGFDQKEIDFKQITSVYRKILPVFGAHPLSNIFNEAPILLVEGEDDERIWQQAVRSSNGEIKIYPCSVDGIGSLGDLEQEAQNIIQAVYDDAKGYSLRDKDGNDDEISDLLPIVRFKLVCRNAENLLLTNEVLQTLTTNWDQLKKNITVWLDNNSGHIHYGIMNGFMESGFDRKNYDIKEVRNDLMGIIGSSKPWEVAIGQTIANLTWNGSTQFNQDGSIYSFLGEKLVVNIIPSEEQSTPKPVGQ
jgi:predicted ATPase